MMNHGWDFSQLKNESNSFSPDSEDVEVNSDQRNCNSISSNDYDNIDDFHQISSNYSNKKNQKNRTTFNKSKNRERKFRQILLDQIIIGCNNNGTPNTRFIVPEKGNPNFVKEYTKTREKYDCLRCRSNQKRIQGKIIGDHFYAPEFHLKSCFAISRIEAEKRLSNNLNKARKKQFIEKYVPSTELPIDKGFVKTEEDEIDYITIDDDNNDEPFINNQSFEQECIITDPNQNCAEINAMEMEFQIPDEIQFEMDEKTISLWQRIQAQNEYLATISQLNESKSLKEEEASEIQDSSISTVTSEQDEIVSQRISPISKHHFFYEINHPSTHWLKNACKKLKLIYNQNVYQFWANNIDIDYISDNTKPNQIQKLKDGNHSGFRALSFLICGQENKKVKNVIYKYFLENYKTLGFFGGIDFSKLTHESEIIKQIIFGEYLTPELWELIAEMLECRIGIFIENDLVKYGNWKSIQTDSGDKNDEIITLLFYIIDKDYCIVTNVINNE